jgi:hypothetical protein
MFSRFFSGFSFNELFSQIQQDWFVFILIFLVTFTLIYLSLSKFFSKKRTQVWGEKVDKKIYIENQPAVVLISVCIALLVTIGFFQSPFYSQAYSFLFSGLNVLFPLVLLGGFIALIFKKFSKSVGSLFAIELVVLIVWGFAKYLYSSDFIYSIPYDFQQILFVISNFWTLIIGLVVGFFLSKIKKK